MNAEEKNLLQQLTGYEGENFDKLINSFGGQKALKNNLFFQFKIVNATGSTKVIALTRAIYDVIKATFTGTAATLSGDSQEYTPAGSVALAYTDNTNMANAGHSDVDYVLDDGTLVTSLTATSTSKKKIRDFLNFIDKVPVVLKKMVINADNKAAFDQNLNIKKVSPFRDTGDDLIIRLDDFRPATNFDSTKVEIDLLKEGMNVQLDNQTLVELPIETGRTITISYHMALLDNMAANFNRKVSNLLD